MGCTQDNFLLDWLWWLILIFNYCIINKSEPVDLHLQKSRWPSQQKDKARSKSLLSSGGHPDGCSLNVVALILISSFHPTLTLIYSLFVRFNPGFSLKVQCSLYRVLSSFYIKRVKDCKRLVGLRTWLAKFTPFPWVSLVLIKYNKSVKTAVYLKIKFGCFSNPNGSLASLAQLISARVRD